MSISDDLKLFGMHNLLLETDLHKLEARGIQIEHTKTVVKVEVVDVDLFESRHNARCAEDGRFLCHLFRRGKLHPAAHLRNDGG